MNKYAIAFVCNDDSYKQGAYAACHSFRKYHPWIDIIVYTYDSNVRNDPILKRYADNILLGDPYIAPRRVWGQAYPEIAFANLSLLIDQRQYDAVCVADSDMLFTKNLTRLFDMAVVNNKAVGNIFDFQNVTGLSK